jgi:hypothetical protein
MDREGSDKFEFSEEFEKSFNDSVKRISEQMDAFNKAFQENSKAKPPIAPSPSVPTFYDSFQKQGVIDRFFGNFTENHSWTRFSHVSGHYRTSVNGNVHFVRGHSRNSGDFWNWAAWTPLSWILFPILFLKLQIHHAWNIKGIFGHLALSAIISLFADLALVLLFLLIGCWLVLKLIGFFIN